MTLLNDIQSTDSQRSSSEEGQSMAEIWPVHEVLCRDLLALAVIPAREIREPEI
jgi:hypothetical protein